VLVGTALILTYLLLRDALGAKGVVWAAMLTAVSPAMVYYSRYYIHEMLLVFFTGLGLVSGWRYWKSRKVGWAILCGASVGLMYATKETFVITLAACGLALGLNQVWNRKLDASGTPTCAPRLNLRHLLAGVGAAVMVWALLFSSFFTNPTGLTDSVATYSHWIGRAGTTSSHVHESSFYLHRLLFFHVGNGPIWSEALIFLLALVGAAAGFFRKDMGGGSASFVRFLTFFTLILTAFYSFLSYKTPWCLLSFWLGFILLAGVGASVLITVARFQWARLATCIALAIGAGQLAAQAWQASLEFGSNPQNPYVYAHSSEDVLELVQKVDALSNAAPEKRGIVIRVMAPGGDYWPLPWYLRSFEHTGWYDNVPNEPLAPVTIVSTQFHANLDREGTHTMAGMFQLRPNVFFELYVETNLWKQYVASR